MTESLTLTAIAGGLILAWVLYLFRRGRLKEDHALMWSGVAIGIIVLSTWTDLLVTLGRVLGAQRVSDVIFAAFIAFLLIVSIYYSVVISALTVQNRRIAQQLALLKAGSSWDVSQNTKKQDGN